MRLLFSIVTVAAVATAAPTQAQDFLRGLARAAGQSAGQILLDRATDAATSAVSGSGTGAAPGATSAPGAPAAPASAAPRQGGRPEMYNADGDRIYRDREDTDFRFHGQPVWSSAAYCAAVQRVVEYDIAEQVRIRLGSRHPYPQETIDSRMAYIPQAVERWRQFGIRRMEIDRGPRAGEAFDPEVERQVALLRQEDWSPRRSWEIRHGACESLYSGTAGIRYDMEVGRGEGSRGAPR